MSHSIIQSCCTPITNKHTVTGLEPWEQSGHLNGHHPSVTQTRHVHTHIYMFCVICMYIYNPWPNPCVSGHRPEYVLNPRPASLGIKGPDPYMYLIPGQHPWV